MTVLDDQFRETQEQRLAKRVHKQLKKQMGWVIDNLPRIAAFKESYEAEIYLLLEDMPYREEIVAGILLTVKPTIKKGWTDMEDQFGFSYGFSYDMKEVTSYLDALEELQLSDRYGSIHATTKDRIRDILSQAANEGWGYSKTSKAIQAQGEAGVFSQARGELIATREIGHAYEYGKQVSIQEYRDNNPVDILQKKWVTVGDNNVTAQCRANSSQDWIEIDKQFDSGDDTAPRDNHPRCRCATTYRILD